MMCLFTPGGIVFLNPILSFVIKLHYKTISLKFNQLEEAINSIKDLLI